MLKNAILMYNYNLILLIPFKIDYSFCFSLQGNLDFLDFLHKKFYYIDYWSCRMAASN